MKPKALIVSLLFVQAVILVSAQDKTTLDGVYSNQQASRGEAVYTSACVGCHQPDLTGDGQTPALVGKDFNSDFGDGSLGDLFDRTKISMPADKPGSLSVAEVTDVIAFILSKGKFPAGTADLPAEAAALKQIKFVSPK
jgi:mono/diheme cytochrome c family protein